MTRLLLTVVALLQALAAYDACFAVTNGRPNILFIFSDDHACQAISAYGSQLTRTPNIDRLATQGMRFDRCYVTNSICGPSRACILTGKYSHKNGVFVNGQQFDSSQQSFPRLLQQAGYQTAIVGKWHLGHNNPPQGFDHWDLLHTQGYYYQPKFVGPLGVRQHVGYVTDLITQYTLQWLEQGRDPSKPFMLMMQHKAPHRPWDPSPEHLDDFEGVEFPEPATLFDDYRNRASAARLAKMRIADDMNLRGPDLKAWDYDRLNTAGESQARDWFENKLTRKQFATWKPTMARKNQVFDEETLAGQALVRAKYQRYLQDYLSSAASVDDSVGVVLDYLDQHGLTDNTLVIYSSDQGFFLGEHGWFDKRFMYEPSLRTPLLARWPSTIEPGRVDTHITSNLDFAETFLEVAGESVPVEMQGASLVPLMRGEQPDEWRKSFYYHYYEGNGHNVSEHYGVTDGRLKLIHYYKLDEWELFDLESDPDEMRSVYGQADYAKRQRRMEQELSRLREELEIVSNDPIVRR
ncbi:MAG: sulfatase [Planctomycetota bacterium]